MLRLLEGLQFVPEAVGRSSVFFETWEADDEGKLFGLLNIDYKVTNDSVTLH